MGRGDVMRRLRTRWVRATRDGMPIKNGGIGMVFSVELNVKFLTGTSCSEPTEAIKVAREMLEKHLNESPIGSPRKDGLFGVEITGAKAEGLRGNYEGREFVLRGGRVIEVLTEKSKKLKKNQAFDKMFGLAMSPESRLVSEVQWVRDNWVCEYGTFVSSDVEAILGYKKVLIRKGFEVREKGFKGIAEWAAPVKKIAIVGLKERQ